MMYLHSGEGDMPEQVGTEELLVPVNFVHLELFKMFVYSLEVSVSAINCSLTR